MAGKGSNLPPPIFRRGVPPVQDTGAGSAIGDAIATGFINDASFTGAAAAPRGLLGRWMGGAKAPRSTTILDGDGSCIGDATCQGQLEDATPAVVVTPPAEGGGVSQFPGVWRNRPGFPKKKKKKLDDLDEMIAELRSRIVEVSEEVDPDFYARTLRVSEALANQPDPSLRAIENQIVLLRAALQEIDDEEAILLLAA